MAQQTTNDTISSKQVVIKDTIKVKGSVSVSGLLQSGNENRFVISLLSELNIGNHKFEALPITSVAYSSKPHAQVEGEYLENIILRFNPNHLFYPASGLSFEKSFLRKIDYRYSVGLTAVCNLLNKERQSIKLGVGLNYEFTEYAHNAFSSAITDKENYSRNLEQVYIRVKGKNSLLKNSLFVSYDFFYQPNIANLNDYRWTMIGAIDVPLKKKFSFRVSCIDSYEEFVATGVHNNNFRLTYGVNLSF